MKVSDRLFVAALSGISFVLFTVHAYATDHTDKNCPNKGNAESQRELCERRIDDASGILRTPYEVTPPDLAAVRTSSDCLKVAILYRDSLKISLAQQMARQAVATATNEDDRKKAKSFLQCCLPACKVPEFADTEMKRIAVAHFLRDWDAVRIMSNYCVKIYPHFEWPQRYLADADIETNKLAEGKRHILKALAINPHYPGAWAELALVKKLQGDAKGAEETLSKAQSLYPNDSVVSRIAERMKLVR